MQSKALTILVITALFFLGACKTNQSDMNQDNPLLKEFTNEYGIPPFEEIENEHFLPAFKQAINEQSENISEIVENEDAPTFENTIEALEFSGLLLSNVSGVFYNLLSSDTNEELEAIAQELASLLTKHEADISYNSGLFEKVKIVYDSKDKFNLNDEQAKLLENTYKNFVRSGINLPKDKQDRLREINENLSKLSLDFGQNNLKEINNYKLVVENLDDLAGLPQEQIDAAAERAKKADLENKWVFTIQKPVLFPFLQYAENRDLREEIFKAYINVGDNDNEFDNKKIIKQIVDLRIEKANILGYNNWAEYILEENMAKTPDNVYELLNNVYEKALPVAKQEAEDLQKMIVADGFNFKLEAWDWWYYAEKLRKSKYDLDENEIRQYLQLDSVQKGLFLVVKKLYNVNIEQVNDVPTYNPEAQAFKVTNVDDGSLVGIVYMDFFTRDSKRAGAWMNNFVNQFIYNRTEQRPIITTNLNISKPADGPTLLTMEEVQTMFHEFGHALHGLFTQCTYPSISGTSVARDFVELPSQVLENWASEPSVLKTFAKHYKTGETIPDKLLQKMDAASKFNQGFATVEYISASILDMDYHVLTEDIDSDIRKFETNSMNKIMLPNEIVVRYRSTYFRHIFSGGYSAGYYGYIWAEVLDADAFEAFKETGDVFNSDVAKAFKQNILERGGIDNPMKSYTNFRGKEPNVEPLLKRKGLL